MFDQMESWLVERLAEYEQEGVAAWDAGDRLTVDVLRQLESAELIRASAETIEHLRMGVSKLLDEQQRIKAKIDQIAQHLMVQNQQLLDSYLSTNHELKDALNRLADAEARAGRNPLAKLDELRDGDPRELLAFLKEQRKPQRADYVELCRETAAVAYLTGEIHEAMDALQDILALLPDDLDAIQRLGHIHHVRGEPDAAKVTYQRMLTLAGDDRSARSAACCGLGLTYKQHDDYKSAENALKKNRSSSWRTQIVIIKEQRY